MASEGPLRVALDAMGGDRAPAEVVKGGLAAARDFGVAVALVGDRSRIEELLGDEDRAEGVTIVHARDVVSMNDHPAEAVRRKRNSSIAVAARLVKEGEADALVSAGHTGAAMAAALFHIGRVRGVDRPAIAVPLPTATGVCLLLDAGANVEVRPEHLVQFAQMGAVYARHVLGLDHPRVGLLNVGEEPTKGSRVVQEAYQRLLSTAGVSFVGNVEGKDVPVGAADVIVCDGFTGNIVLKLAEGLSAAMFELLRRDAFAGWRGAVAGALLRPSLRRIRRRLDYAEFGGAPLLGVDGVVAIAHGRSDRRAIRNAIRAAVQAARQSVPARIGQAMDIIYQECEARA
ncbi:MAG: phosphate acyltransferase PlsX [Firmicutes bacterium]|nr:phosphate acyltransferase PlsX [Bacillota bacterium]